MIEKSQGNAQTNKKEKEYSKIGKYAEQWERKICISKKVLYLGNVDTR